MCLFRYENDPEPEERIPAGLLYVPVRPGSCTQAVVRLFRTPPGTRTAVGFTSAARLTAVLGAGHPYIRLSEAALRGMCEPLGAGLVTVDPALSAPPVTPVPAPAADAAGAEGPAGARDRAPDPGRRPGPLPVRTV
ncbi:SAV_915 family protein [Streptomyces sp. BR123]|uniref:SAV_915 family protein n=1 Tax=Streptomyces sp. BR123 TaxID=2749828 RepID=UPI00211B15BF|nr:SAV_915 family protein [Streptomyces sp. BR123]